MVVAVWEDDEATLTASGAESGDLLFSVWDAATTSWSAGRPVVPRDPASLGGFPVSLTSTAAGVQLAGYDGDGHLAWTTLPPGTTVWSAPVPITDPQLEPLAPQLHGAPDGTLMLTWSIQKSRHALEAALLHPGTGQGTTLPPAFKGQPFTAYSATIAADGQPAAVIATSTRQGTQAQVSVYTPGGLGSSSPASDTPIARPDVAELAPLPIFRGNAAHTGGQPGPGLTGSLAVHWQWAATPAAKSANGQMTAPSLVDGVVYVGTAIGGGSGGIHAVDAASGDLRWIYPTTDFVTTPRTVADGIVYAVDQDNTLSAGDAATGKLIWHAQASIHSKPAVTYGIAYVSTVAIGSHAVVALDARAGKQVWSSAADEVIESSPTVVDGVVYIGGDLTPEGDTYPGVLYALDAETGKEIWRVKAASSSNDAAGVNATPAVYGGMVYAAARNGVLYAVEAEAGQIRWQAKDCGGTVAAAQGVVYCGGRLLYAFDSITGTELWSTDLGGRLAAPVVSDGAVYVAGQGTLFVVDAATGDERSRLRVPVGLTRGEGSPLACSTREGDRGQGRHT